MTAAALKAGKAILRDFGEIGNLQISRKGTADFATAADKRSEKILFQELQKARPTCGFLMEEGGEVPGSDPTHRFVIDPIDGTHNFIHAIPYFCISIGYEKQKADGTFETHAGVIYDPMRNELFSAELYQGAHLDDTRMSVSRRDEPDACMIATYFPSKEAGSHEARVMSVLQREPYSLRSCGATALDLAYVAAGRYDATCHMHFKPWDVSAGALMVREAGGLVHLSQNAGKPLIFASSKPLYEKLATDVIAA